MKMSQDNQIPGISEKQTSTVVGGWSVAVARTLAALGYDGDALFRSAGIDLSRKQDTDTRFSSDNTRKLWALALTETGQEHIGLLVANYVCPTTFHALGFSLWASSSLLAALQRMVRFEVLLNDGCHLSLNQHSDNCYSFTMQIRQSDNQPLVAAEGVDYFLAAVVKMFRDMSDSSFAPLEVNLQRPPPANPEIWKDYFRCPVNFNAPDNRLLLSGEPLQRPLPTGNPLLAEQNDKLVEDYLQRLQMADLLGQVRSTLINLMPLGLTTLEDVAAELNMVPRTLQYKLSQHGTTIQTLRDRIRQELAQQYLQFSRKSITEIAYSLGFSDPAHLNRAFKRWTGETPTAFRTRNL